MRTSFIVGIFALAVAVAGGAEWASRRAAGKPVEAGASSQTKKGPDAGLTETTPVADRESVGSPAPLQPERTESASERPGRTLVLGEGQGGFRLNAVALSDDAIARIDELVASLDPELVGVHFVIEGHTDSLGSKDVNQKIGLARALAVRQCLADRYEIPRDLMRVVSYGSERPAADNATQEGRSLNRRVVIKVIE